MDMSQDKLIALYNQILEKTEELRKTPLVFASSPKKPYVEVYRLQNDKGEGPYSGSGAGGDTKWQSEPHIHNDRTPHPANDEGFKSRDHDALDFFNERHPGEKFFGFENLDHLNQWFKPEELDRLNKLGFKPQKVKAQKVWSSGKQAFYLPYEEEEKLAATEILQKPYVSEAQRRWAHTPTGEKALGGESAVHEWDSATRGKSIPEKVGKDELMFSEDLDKSEDHGLCSMFLFEGVDHPDILHVTHQYFGKTFNDAKAIIEILEKYFKENPFKSFTVNFDNEDFFGADQDIRVLRPSKEDKIKFLLDLKSQLDDLYKDKFPDYKPHVTVSANVEKCHIPITRYALVKGGDILWSTDSNDLNKSESLDKVELPQQKGQIHSTHGYVAKIHPSGKLMWHNGPQIASAHDKNINSPKLRNQFLNTIKSPTHRALMSHVIDMTAKDSNRHFIPSQENGRETLRARHINNLLLGRGNYTINTSDPNRLVIENQERHGISKGPSTYGFKAVAKSEADYENSGHDEGRDSEDGAGVRSSGDSGRTGIEICDESSGAPTANKSGVQFRDIVNKLLQTPSWHNSYLRHKPTPVHQPTSLESPDPIDHLKNKLLDSGKLIYHPSKGFIKNIRLINRGNGFELNKSEPIMPPQELIHYSTTGNLKQIDPLHAGTGAPSARYKQGVPEHKTSFYYIKGSQPENLVTQSAKSKYNVKLGPEHKLYDLSADPLKMMDRAHNEYGVYDSDILLGNIKNAGYHGVWYPRSENPVIRSTVELFHPHPVHSEEMLRNI